ncbi:hypothetical protein [Terrabacter sp. RAF57]|uniref:hypothetical protein n=1 Tax=Terrabacter sp. RAF57 TaxID=3233063 RepID=UPI003F99C207
MIETVQRPIRIDGEPVMAPCVSSTTVIVDALPIELVQGSGRSAPESDGAENGRGRDKSSHPGRSAADQRTERE